MAEGIRCLDGSQPRPPRTTPFTSESGGVVFVSQRRPQEQSVVARFTDKKIVFSAVVAGKSAGLIQLHRNPNELWGGRLASGCTRFRALYKGYWGAAVTNAGMNQDRMALTEIGRIAAAAGAYGEQGTMAGDGQAGASQDWSCRIMPLPPRLVEQSARHAIRVNPSNAPLREQPVPAGMVSPPQRLVVLVGKYWGATQRVLSVSFMEPTPPDLRARILSHMNAWGTGVSFAETSGIGEVRISRGPGGYWSYLGTDIALVPPSVQTMNLEGFTMSTSEAEFRRVVRHETGHTLGFPHEHLRRELVQRIDPLKAYAYYFACCGWPPEMVDSNVLTSLEESSIFGTPVDQTSIMCYPIQASITKDGSAIPGGGDFSFWDLTFARSIYPPVPFAPSPAPGADGAAAAIEWDPAQDVAVPV